ncbi:short chain dehydrogenase reductase family superfamily [Phaffia rhodozyma]|uniref:Short chain dehydrogenase reductase family superfamily n=1 Tax=Phaffia rhodozyma TaxID=264483 RepID=A0A0F7SXX7_PHARH|nr:short chain dehydrogenase reductase family superfamily [Phaffia rhodozyma]
MIRSTVRFLQFDLSTTSSPSSESVIYNGSHLKEMAYAPLKALIVGANRGLGLALTKELHKRGTTVYATTRSPAKEGTFPDGVHVIEGIDVGEPGAGKTLVEKLEGAKLDLTVIVAGLLKEETFKEPDFQAEMDMYKICAVGPVFITSALSKSSFASNAKLILLTSEGGSITLRTEKEGGGMFGHHGSKAAANMVGHLLSYDLKPKGVTVVMIHPGFLITDMTGGMKDHYKKGGAVKPEVAAPIFLDFVDTVTLKHTGQFWAPMGPKGIGNAEEVLGKDLPTPLQLPW